MSEVQIEKIEGRVASSDGVSSLRTMIWNAPDIPTIASVQLVHGMVEHIDRYDAFARHLASLGFYVVGHDHIGHGKSTTPDKLGVLPLDKGKECLVQDVHVVYQALLSDMDVPRVLFGHSMGSFISRVYCTRFADTLRGVVVCGTGNQPRALSAVGNALARMLGSLRGEAYQSKLLHNMAIGAFASAIKDARTQSDWLSTDAAAVDAYIADPLTGVMFSVGGYAALLGLTKEVVTPQHAQAVPSHLPMLFIAGDQDPVGEKGVAVRAAAELYRTNGVQNVTTILYEGMRHEILNERGKEQVYQEVVQWIEENCL